MTYGEWAQQANLTQFKSRLISSLNNLNFRNNLVSTDAFLQTILDAVKARYFKRTIYWTTPAEFEDNLWLHLVFEIPDFVAKLKKYDFFEMLHSVDSFGMNKTISESTNLDHKGTGSKTGNNTNTNESTNRSTSEVRNQQSSNSSSTDTNTALGGGVPNMSTNGDTLDTSILAYDKNVSKNTSSDTTSGNSTNNTTNSGTSSDNSRFQIDESSTNNYVDVGSRNLTNNEIDKQAGVLNILNSQFEWKLHFNELIDSLELLFIGVSYYEF